MNNLRMGAGVLAVVVGGGFWALSGQTTAPEMEASTGTALANVTPPATLGPLAAMGETAFTATCAACHGTNAAGIDGAGPPLVHKIYEPSHHGDESFFRAVQNGVPSHHWSFGDMPPVDGLTGGDVKAIVAYIREVQRANGIQ